LSSSEDDSELSEPHSTLGLKKLFLEALDWDEYSTNRLASIPTIGPENSIGPVLLPMPAIAFVPDVLHYLDTDDEGSTSEASITSWSDTDSGSSDNGDFRAELVHERGDYVLQVIE